jgi:RNA 2',3'-cyclic 3'-phosphodiesterase
MEERWRCFVAVPLGKELRRELSRAVSDLRAAIPEAAEGLRWTEPDGWHLTLAFLGWVSPEGVEAIGRAVASVAAGRGPFEVSTGGLGGFPSRHRVRVLWYGLAGNSPQLGELARATRLALGVDDDSPYRAHLTLARSRAERGIALPETIWQMTLPSGQIAVDRLVLYRSHLGRGPARYEPLAEAPLGALAGVTP